ncbi:MAG: MlaC/ttg2D family ABC transporter substrate-binding protein [Pseudomonadota bacterium]
MSLKSLFALSLLLPALWLASPAVAEPRPAHETLKEATDELLSRLEAEENKLREDDDALREVVDEQLVPLIDFEVSSQWVLGRHWRGLDEEQQATFQEEFQRMLIRFYADALLEFDAWDLRYDEMRRDNPDKPFASVRAQAVPEDGKPIDVRFRVILRNGEWRIFDVAIAGVSAVKNYRSTFGEVLADNDFDTLIEQMRDMDPEDDPVMKATSEEVDEEE